MKISWLNIKTCFDQCCGMYSNIPLETLKKEKREIQRKLKDHIYKHHYRNVDRMETLEREDVLGEWREYAVSAIEHPNSRWDVRKLQLHRNASNVFVEKADLPLRPADKVISIYHKVRESPLGCRINVIVKAEYAGVPLYEKLKAFLSSSSAAVVSWKVMNPYQGAIGPDSAVIYCSGNFSGPEVESTVIALSRKLSGGLEDTSLFGLQRLNKGLYGCELPDRFAQQRLGVNDINSAGEIISALIAKAVYGVLKYKLTNQKMSENTVKDIINDYFSVKLPGWGWILVD